MTIAYPDSFSKSLLLWNGSLWKAVIKDIIVFYILYYIILIIQVTAIKDEDLKKFHSLIDTAERGCGYIPLTFLLGFFVAGVLARWWEQFNWISWPDKLMMTTNIILPGPENRKIRRTIARWSNLQAAMAWRLLSVRTKARFPTEQHLVDSGLMTAEEKRIYDQTNAPYGKWFIPIIWLTNLFADLRKKNIIKSDTDVKHLTKVMLSYRDGFAMLMVYDWIVIPLVYVQVVSIATYGYFSICLLARQPKFYPSTDESETAEHHVPIPFPLFTTLQLLFYLGWLKVAQFLMHPFGDDDDDFELNWILDRNYAIAYLIGDELSDQLPDYETDPFDGQAQFKLPHTKASVKIKDIEPADNLAALKFKEKDTQIVKDDELRLLHSQDGVARFQSLVRTLSQRKHNRRQESLDVGEPPNNANPAEGQ